MIPYGISTSQAHYWVHVSPLECAIYVYERAEMVRRLDNYRTVEIVSARGRLVPRTECFIRRVALPKELFNGVNWRQLPSDAVGGEAAEQVVRCWINLYGVFPPTHMATAVEDRDEQFTGIDFRMQPVAVKIEVKLDTPIPQTGNLFVQVGEYKHQWNGRNEHRIDIAF